MALSWYWLEVVLTRGGETDFEPPPRGNLDFELSGSALS